MRQSLQMIYPRMTTPSPSDSPHRSARSSSPPRCAGRRRRARPPSSFWRIKEPPSHFTFASHTRRSNTALVTYPNTATCRPRWAPDGSHQLQGAYTFEIVEFKAFQGHFTEESKAIFSDKKHKKYRTTADS